jgi:hypothetical protein
VSPFFITSEQFFLTPIPGKGDAMNGTKVVLDFSGDSAHVASQRQLLEGLAQKFPGQTIVLSTSGMTGDRVVPVIAFQVTLKSAEQPQAAAV